MVQNLEVHAGQNRRSGAAQKNGDSLTYPLGKGGYSLGLFCASQFICQARLKIGEILAGLSA
jgi:hypothetical protein